MKTLLSRGIPAALLALVAGATPAVAQVYEGFNYAPGAPLTAVGNGGLNWLNNWNLAGGGDWTVDSIGSTYSSGGSVLATSGRRIIAANATTQRTMNIAALGTPGTTAWVSFIAQQTSGSASQSWTGVKLPCTGPNAFLFLGKPYNKPFWGTDAGSIASHKQSTVPATQKAFIVARIDFKAGADDVYVWVNPGLNSVPTAGSAAVNAPAYGDFTGITKVVTEVGSLGGLITSNVDEIRVSDSFAGVAPKRPGVLFDGVMAAEVGAAHVNVGPDGDLQVENLGSSGQDGVRLELKGARGYEMEYDVGPLGESRGHVEYEWKVEEGESIAHESATGMGDGSIQFHTDFTSVNAEAVHYKLINSGGAVVAEGDYYGGPGQGGGITYKQNNYCPPGWHAVWTGYWHSTGGCCPTEIWIKVFAGCEQDIILEGPWGQLAAAQLELSPLTPVPHPPLSGCGSLTITGADCPGIELRSFKLRDRNITNTLRGEAILENTSPDMEICNIGSSGQDGVRLEFPGAGRAWAAMAPSQCLSNNGVGEMKITTRLKMASGEVKNLRCTMAPVSDTRMRLTFDASELGASSMTVGGSSGGTSTGGGSGDPQGIIIYIDGMYWGTYDHIPFWVYQLLSMRVTNPTGNGNPGTVTLDNNGVLSSFQADELSVDFGGVPEQPVSIESVEITGSDWAGNLTISGQGAEKACPADFNGDGFLDFFDVDAFIAAFENGDAGGDFNGDGFIDFFDIDAFNQAFEAGC